VPGHHFEIALKQERTDLPMFRRFSLETAFSEGWGLYAESLGKPLGVYTDPYSTFGYLENELWRAIRLVTDTGLHSKGWTREQVIAYMRENSAESETQSVAEAERYVAIPGQALAYKIGELKIKELRSRAEKALGPNNPNVAISLNNLALFYNAQKQYSQAEPLYKRVLAISRKTLGPDHPNVALSLNNLAGLYKDQGKYPHAEPLFRQALAISEKVLGRGHPHVATSLENLAQLYREIGHPDKAEPLDKRAAAIRSAQN